MLHLSLFLLTAGNFCKEGKAFLAGVGNVGHMQQQQQLSLFPREPGAGCMRQRRLELVQLFSRTRKVELEHEEPLEDMLKRFKLSHNVVNITASEEEKSDVIVVEIFASGKVQFGILTGVVSPDSASVKLELVMLPDPEQLAEGGAEVCTETAVVDLGQVITLWKDTAGRNAVHDMQEEEQHFTLSAASESITSSLWIQSHVKRLSSSLQQAYESLSLYPSEKPMQTLYSSKVGRGRSQLLTKKQINAIADPHVQNILRTANKAGTAMKRLVTSNDAGALLFDTSSAISTEQRMLGGLVLANDAKLGGRFKRLPCTLLSTHTHSQNANTAPSSQPQSVSILNGGWLAVDSSVKAGAEARKFVQRATEVDGDKVQTNKNDSSSGGTTVQLLTSADERIAYRLECLAMGEDNFSGMENNEKFELDVRTALSSLGLPLSPNGAKRALLRIGRWSQLQPKDGQSSPNSLMVQPWSTDILNAANQFVDYDKKRKKSLLRNSISAKAKKGHDRASEPTLENRIDLTDLPCVCIDAKGVAFRDDAIGIRPRSMTGRNIIPGASKWEILVHIADVSDIYSPSSSSSSSANEDSFAPILQNAAASRGYSRYDLPYGPLHLLPPLALQALSLQTMPVTKLHETPGSSRSVNRCVTLWAYIDENTGKILDIGLERTLISSPVALTFGFVSSLLNENDTAKLKSDPTVAKLHVMLSVMDRIFSSWSAYHHRTNEAASKRQARLQTKQVISSEIGQYQNNPSNKSGSAFRWSRGHRIVDNSMELYAFGAETLLRRRRVPIPRASGSSDRAGRLGTAPLRRYIDGVLQRQALSALCDFGGEVLSREECYRATKIAAKTSHALNNFFSGKKGAASSFDQMDALKSLERHFAGIGNGKKVIQAISTGRQNEVVIVGIGAVAKCRGIKGTLKPGKQVTIEVTKLDPDKGKLSVKLYER